MRLKIFNPSGVIAMTVKEIFELRKQGRIEEAYEAIRPMYASHKGKYTTLYMFWTAHDVLKLRLEQGRIDEARKIYQALISLGLIEHRGSQKPAAITLNNNFIPSK